MTRIYVWGTLVVPEGKDAEFRRVVDELVGTVRSSDPGTVSVGFLPDPGRPGSYEVQEVYADAASQWAHVQNVGALLGELGDLGVSLEDFTVAGEPTTEARAALDALGVSYVPVVAEVWSTCGRSLTRPGGRLPGPLLGSVHE